MVGVREGFRGESFIDVPGPSFQESLENTLRSHCQILQCSGAVFHSRVEK